MSSRDAIAGVVVTYFPDRALAVRLEEILKQVWLVIIIDNGSPREDTEFLNEWASRNGSLLIQNGNNLGLASALNQGFRAAIHHGCDWVVTFDQDSTPQEGMIEAQWTTLHSGSDPKRIAIVGAHTFDEQSPLLKDRWLRPKWYGFERLSCGESDLENVTFVITSGALTRSAAWESIGGFHEPLFIDYVDHDFCLRLLRKGWKIQVSARARLAHNLGAKRRVEALGRTFRPTFHSSRRHFYMARNRILIWRRHAIRFPHWWLFDLCFGLLNAVRVLLAEDRRGPKVLAMARGTLHGLLGKSGADERTEH